MDRLAFINKVMTKLAKTPEKEVERFLMAFIKGTPFNNKTYSVGGFVRDELLGKPSKDLDIVVEMEKGAEKLTKLIHEKYPTETSSPHNLGKDYPIWHLSFKKDIKVGEETFKTNEAEVDFADTQKESFPDPKTRQRVTQPGNLEEDIARRDFTVNMLLRDLSSGEIKDLTGVSKEDLEKGVLKGHPRVSLDKTFSDDPLRMIRLIRFQAKYGWEIPLEVLKTVKRNADRIKIISSERIRDELVKIMQIGKLAKAIKLMKAVGLLKHVMPEIQDLHGVKQPEIYHAEGDVLKHTLKVLENAKPTVEAQLAALFHDVGKKSTQQFIGEKIQFLGHEDVSAEIAEAIMRNLKFDNKTIEKVKTIVKNHMRPHDADVWGSKAVRKFVRDLGEDLEDVLHMAEIDTLGSWTTDKKPQKSIVPDLREKIKKVLEVPISRKPILSGLEVMDFLGIKTGPEVGKALKLVIDIEDDLASEGKKPTKEEIKGILKEKWKH